MKKPTISYVKVSDWIDENIFPSYHANRDVTKRMKKSHLSGPLTSPEQAIVRAVKFDNDLIKIDGHSRAEAWRRGQLEEPPFVMVVTFEVSSEEEMANLYRSFNSKEAAETASEYMYHIRKLKNFNPESAFMKSSWKSAYRTISAKYVKEELAALEDFWDEHAILDGWNVDVKNKKAELSVGVRASMLVSLKKDVEKATIFWQAYLDDENKNYAEVNRLKEFIAEMKASGASGGVSVGMIYATSNGLFDSFLEKRK